MDGEVNYSTFNRAQLEEALTRIDRARYPINFENLTRELALRPPDAPVVATVDRHARMLRWIKAIGITDIATACFLTVFVLDDLQGVIPGVSAAMAAYSLLMIGAVVSLNLAGGILTIKGRVAGYWISLVNHACQIPVVSAGPVAYRYDGFGSIELYWQQVGPVGFYWQWGPGFSASYGGKEALAVSVDVLALAFVLLLRRAIVAAGGVTANYALERTQGG